MIKKLNLAVVAVWSSISVFSSNAFFPQNENEQTDGAYIFEPDADYPNVEVAPLDVNNKDEDVPYPPSSSDSNTLENGSISPSAQPVFYPPKEQYKK